MLLVGVLLAYFLILIGFLLLWHEKVYRDAPEDEVVEVVIDRADAWEGIDRARSNHPSPDAHSELTALEVDGPVHVHARERVVRVR